MESEGAAITIRKIGGRNWSLFFYESRTSTMSSNLYCTVVQRPGCSCNKLWASILQGGKSWRIVKCKNDDGMFAHDMVQIFCKSKSREKTREKKMMSSFEVGCRWSGGVRSSIWIAWVIVSKNKYNCSLNLE